MKGHTNLGRVFGVQVGPRYCWFVIVLLITLSLAGQFYCPNPVWSMRLIWALDAATSVLFVMARLTYNSQAFCIETLQQNRRHHTPFEISEMDLNNRPLWR